MAEAPAQKRKHDKVRRQEAPPGEVQPRGAPTESASSLGNVAIFTDVWGWRVKAGWTSNGHPAVFRLSVQVGSSWRDGTMAKRGMTTSRRTGRPTIH
ncbi:hypothetical protein GQ600_3912 [Phytophthora cactorum]|nr:hypothetical protein GQ600_3912 [Phytophthora cactorum]